MYAIKSALLIGKYVHGVNPRESSSTGRVRPVQCDEFFNTQQADAHAHNTND